MTQWYDFAHEILDAGLYKYLFAVTTVGVSAFIVAFGVRMVFNAIRKKLEITDKASKIRNTQRSITRLLQSGISYRVLDFTFIIETEWYYARLFLQAAIAFHLVRLLSIGLKYLFENQYLVKGEDSYDRGMKGAAIIINVVLWPLAIVVFLNFQGYNISAILAGVGIGGIAIALAAQNILVDVFNYFVIYFDKPFELGDFIILDDKKGTVEFIGLKTTRLKALDGEQLILSNSDLTKSRIHNYKRMEQRRVAFSLKVPFTTQPEMLKQIPVFLGEMIGGMAGLTFDRAHLLSIGEYSFNYEIVYVILTGDYNIFADVQYNINIKIVEEFTKRGIQFAIPAQHQHHVGTKYSSNGGNNIEYNLAH
jgi:small-conductance mechanosensitive channel